MHVSRSEFLKTCGLALMASGADTPVLRAAAGAPEATAIAGGDIFVGQILTVPYNFAPVGFALCQGQLLSIAQNTPLFSLLGTTYGATASVPLRYPTCRAACRCSWQGPASPIAAGRGGWHRDGHACRKSDARPHACGQRVR